MFTIEADKVVLRLGPTGVELVADGVAAVLLKSRGSGLTVLADGERHKTVWRKKRKEGDASG
jgi:hypothetical protein